MPIQEKDLDKNEKADWNYYYQFSIAMGLISGTMLAIASRMSNVLCKPGGLYHEAYITLYAQVTCIVVIPLFIVTNAKRLSHLDNGESTETDINTKLMQVATYVFLFLVIFAKVYVLERGTMSRFVEDYIEDVHKFSKFINYFFDKTGDDVIKEEMEVISDADSKADEDDSEIYKWPNKGGDKKIANALARGRSPSERYNRHVQSSRRGTVNL